MRCIPVTIPDLMRRQTRLPIYAMVIGPVCSSNRLCWCTINNGVLCWQKSSTHLFWSESDNKEAAKDVTNRPHLLNSLGVVCLQIKNQPHPNSNLFGFLGKGRDKCSRKLNQGNLLQNAWETNIEAIKKVYYLPNQKCDWHMFRSGKYLIAIERLNEHGSCVHNVVLVTVCLDGGEYLLIPPRQ